MAVAVSVLAGALLVGASVRASLRELALARLGATDVVVSSNGYFRAALARDVSSPEIAAVVPIIAVQGTVVHEESRRTASRVNIFGIDDRFFAFHGQPAAAPAARDAWISEALRDELRAADGDALIVRVAKPTDIPLGHLQGRRDETSERIRLTAARVLTRGELGEFSLVPAQGPALTVFVPLSRLQQDLDVPRRANALLVRMAPPLRDDVVADVYAGLAPAVQLEDVGLRVRTTDDVLILESRTGLLPEEVWRRAADTAADRGGRAVGVLTHLANTIRANGREIPYSLIAAMDLRAAAGGVAATTGAHPPMLLNEWAAQDLGIAPGTSVEIEYYLWSDHEGLLARTATFSFAGVVPMNAAGGDATLTPEYPGITDAEDVMSWDPPFPVDLQRIRKADEAYWDTYRAAPKAFIPLEVGQKLWPSPYGTLSSLRTPPIPDWPPLPALQGQLAVRHARAEALAAAEGTTDFGEYFVYFSFFIVVSALLLAGMFFALSVEQRARELGVLTAMGFRHADVRRTLLVEAAVVASAGALLGMAGAIGYAAFIMYGLRTWWIGAVNTTALRLVVDPLLLTSGAAAALLAALAGLLLVLRRVGQVSTRAQLLGGLTPSDPAHITRPSGSRLTAIVTGTLALLLLAGGAAGLVPPVAAFFAAGGLLLTAGAALFATWLRRSGDAGTVSTLTRFGASYARWRPLRSVLSASLIAFACFVIVAVGAFRRDASGLSLDPSSGTGGFVLMAEAAAPLMHNPNTPGGREELSLTGYDTLSDVRFARFRLRPGDEASCLTLYEPKNPRLIAPERSFVDERRFSFAEALATTDAERANPWLLLDRSFDDGAIPAIADQTSLTYVFHLSVGDDFVFTPEGGEPIRLRIVATLADSLLQSELIIGEQHFTRLFPSHEGYRVWLIEAPEERAADVTTLLEERLADFGVDVVDTRARLAAYHQVENTYLSTFQALGALGLLLGTLGLAAVLARNALERRRELALLAAVGFTSRHLRRLVRAESLLLVTTGVALGTISALVAIAPALFDRPNAVPVTHLMALVTSVILTGLIASSIAVRVATASRTTEALRSE